MKIDLRDKSVWSLVYPETEKLISKLWKKDLKGLYHNSFDSKQLDYHLRFKNQWLRWTKDVLKLPNFSYFYPSHGSSEAIRETIAQYSLKRGKRIHVFRGEYEGFAQIAKSYNVEVIIHDREDYKSIKIDPKEKFYISQPSSIDGNLWPHFHDFLTQMERNNPHCEIMVDLCYVGTVAKDYQINLHYPQVHTIFFSLSKVFGVYYHRIGGVFSREEIPSMYGNQWFKNIFSLLIGTSLMKRFKVNELPKKYNFLQHKTVNFLKKYEKCKDLISSDVIFLSHGEAKNSPSEEFIRDQISYRVCLSRFIDKEFR